MLLDHLIPRSLTPEVQSEGPTLLHNLFMQLHLDRKIARSLGWRGFLPSNAGNFSWTTRLAHSDMVYGIVFMGEEFDDQAIASAFDLYCFPVEDEMLAELSEPMRSHYREDAHIPKIRELSKHYQELADFKVGTLSLVFLRDKTGLNLSIVTTKRDARFSLRALRPLRALMPLFSALTHSFEEVFNVRATTRRLKTEELSDANEC